MSNYSLNDKRPLNAYKRFMADKYHRAEIVPWWKAPVFYDAGINCYYCSILGFHLIFRFIIDIKQFLTLFGWEVKNFYTEQLDLRKTEKLNHIRKDRP